jgi:hypothetical protein
LWKGGEREGVKEMKVMSATHFREVSVFDPSVQRNSLRYVPCVPTDLGAKHRANLSVSSSPSSSSSSQPPPEIFTEVIDAKILQYAVQKVRPQTTPEGVARFEEFSKQFGVLASEKPDLF